MGARNLKAVVYTDDYGNQFATKIDAAIFAQTGASTAVKVGGSDYTGVPALAPLPAQLRQRHVLVSAAGRPKRRVVCLSPDSELFDGTETTIDLPDLGGAAVTFTRYKPKAEEYPSNPDPAG